MACTEKCNVHFAAGVTYPLAMTNPDTVKAGDRLPDAEKKLRESDALHRETAATQTAILNALPAQIALLDRDGVILTLNEPWRRFAAAAGTSAIESSPGMNYLEACARATEATGPELAAGIRSVLRGQADRFSLEYSCQLPARRCWLRMIVTPLANDGIGAAVVSIIDVTDRKLVEQELRLNQQQFSNAFEHSAIGKAIVGIDGRLLKVNPSFAKMLGYTVEEMHELDFQRLTHPEDLEVGVRGRQRVLDGEVSSYHAEKRYLHREGHVIWAALTTSLVRDADGRPLHTIAEIEDITGKRLAIEELRRSAGELRKREEELARINRALRMLTNCNEALIRAGDERDLLEHMCRIAVEDGGYAMAWVGFVADDEIGTIVPRAQAGSDAGYLDDIWLCASDRVPQGLGPGGTTARTGVLTVCEDLETSAAFYWRAEARERGFRGVIALPLREGDRTFGIMILYSTEPRPVPPEEERLLQELADDMAFGIVTLRARAERRSLEAQFLRAQRLESLGTLAGGIAHDLNNVLAPIVMGVSYLKRGEGREKVLAIIRNIEKSAQRGTDLVKQVLAFGRGAGGERVPVRIDDVVSEIASIIRSTFPKNIVLDLAVVEGLPTVPGDATQLHQVLLNLCVNARDAMPDGGRLSLKAGQVDVDAQFAAMNASTGVGPHVVLEVADEGSGMTREVMDRVFDPFFTTKPPSKGTGLGLSTVLGIVRSHGGFVNVYSEPRVGSTFKIYLPADNESVSPVAAVAREAGMLRGHGELALIVDDEAAILSVTSQTLETYGYRTLTASDGAEAVALYAQHRAELAVVITDMMMPVMDGPALIVALQRMDPSLPIVGTSGLGGGDNVSRARQAGVAYFLTKPYSAEVLLAMLRTALDARAGKP